MSVAEDMRAAAAKFREIGESSAKQHVSLARELLRARTPEARIAIEAMAGVADCMARRYRQWATHYEAAAAECDECEAPNAAQ